MAPTRKRIWVGAVIALVAAFAIVQTFGFARDQYRRTASEDAGLAMFNMVEVPDVRGLPLRSARQTLSGQMLYVGRVRTAAQAGERLDAVVIAQNPRPGSLRRADSAVTLTTLTDWPLPYRYIRWTHPDGPVPAPR
jgi:hypothetical protein